MANSTTITVRAAAAKSLTLAELVAFVDDATRQKIDPSATIKVRATFVGGGIKTLSVTGRPEPQ